MKSQVLDIKGTKVKDLDLNDNIWAITPHDQAMFDTVVAQQAAARQGTSKVKTRAEVSGGGRKPWKQKGTGRARQGSIRAPQWRGGGIAFGPTGQKNYKIAVNKKVKVLAMKSALSLKAKEDNLVILDKFQFNEPSTKQMVEVLGNLKIDGQKVLIVTKDADRLVFKSGANIPAVNVINRGQMNVVDLLNATKLIITEEAVQAIEEVYA